MSIKPLTVMTAILAAAIAATAAFGQSADPDLIFRKSTTFKLLTPNDKLAVYGIDDPVVDGSRLPLYGAGKRRIESAHSGLPSRPRTSRWLAGNTGRSSSKPSSSRARLYFQRKTIRSFSRKCKLSGAATPNATSSST